MARRKTAEHRSTRAVRRSQLQPPPTERVRNEWSARVAAEYTSAAITQHLVHWLIQIGASPDLLEAGLAIVKDELAHARMSHTVYSEAGGTTLARLDRGRLELPRSESDPLEIAALAAIVRVFCLGETVAVPLFARLRAYCTVPAARAALDRVLKDEVRHRDFGWMALDWMMTSAIGPQVPALVVRELPGMFAELELTYGTKNLAFGHEPSEAVTEAERAWGLAPPKEYVQVLHRAFERDFAPRFAERGIDAKPAWDERFGVGESAADGGAQ